MTGPSEFAALHTGPVPFLLPNAWDLASGLLLADAGFPAVGTTSLGVTAAAGLPDGAGAGRDLTVTVAAATAARTAAAPRAVPVGYQQLQRHLRLR